MRRLERSTTELLLTHISGDVAVGPASFRGRDIFHNRSSGAAPRLRATGAGRSTPVTESRLLFTGRIARVRNERDDEEVEELKTFCIDRLRKGDTRNVLWFS